MKMDKQHRLRIPKFVRDMIGLKESGYYFLNYEEDNKFLLQENKEGKIIDRVKVDEKGRFCVPSSVSDVFDSKKIIMYVDGETGQVGISILKEDA